MGKNQPVQHSFAAGEISPLMEMRHDWTGRASAVRTMQNWYATPQGPAKTRHGFHRVEGVPGAIGELLNFQVNNFTSYLITVTQDVVHISDENGFISDDDLIENGNFNDGGTGWTDTEVGNAIVTFPGGYAYLKGGSVVGHYAQIEQEATVVANAPHKLAISILEGEDDMEVSIGSTLGDDDIYPATVFTGHPSIILEDLETTGTSMFIRLRVYGANGFKTISSVSMYDTASPLVPLEFVSPWTEITDILLLQDHMPPRELSMYFVCPRVIPHRLVYELTTNSWTFEPVPFTSIPTEWGTGNYPHAMTFFEGRAYYGGISTLPEDFWGSRPGSSTVDYYTDMTLGSNPDDALQHTLSRKGLIQWMEGSDTLLMGTETGEYIVTSKEGIIIPGDIKVVQQSANGSSPMKAVLAGNNVLYTSSNREQIRSMSFEWTKDAWQSKDLTFIAEHLTRGDKRILKMVYANSPDGIIWALTLDGCLIGATYDALAQTAGFHSHHSQDPAVAIVTRRFAGNDELWALFDRDGADGELSLEKYEQDGPKIDSHIHLEFTEDTTEIVGADHLAGRVCQVLVDGAVHPDVTIEPDGSFELDYAATHTVQVGLGYDSTLVTLPRDDGMSTGGFSQGSSRPSEKRWNKMWARVISSWKPLINGQRPPERHATSLMNEIEPAVTEDVQVSLRGWDKDAVITIVQDLPVHTTIGGIFGELNQEII